MSEDELDRYARHILLREVGASGQGKLKRARVMIVGAGGLGGPAALYLAAAGVGTLALADHDAVSASNLQRQILFTSHDLGRAKVDAGADALSDLNPHVRIEALLEPITAANAAHRLSGFDVVLDGTDDFASRFAVNAACVALQTPLVSGAVGRWDGQVGVFHPAAGPAAPCYQCFVPAAPPDAERCAEVGVVGALTGVIGAMMALEAIKLITGAGEPLIGRMLFYDGLAGRTRTTALPRDPSCAVCAGRS